MKVKYIIGIDEAGRGPLAGPVAIGVVMCKSDFNMRPISGVRDSKKLSEKQRAEWFAKLKALKKNNSLDFKVSLIGSQTIDRKGISYAIKKGIASCLKRLKANHKTCKILLDGSLKAPKKYLDQKTIIGGDDKVKLISLASVAAKVTRDRKMKRLTKVFPKYGFEVHKGYGTASHIKAIRKWGQSPIHRRSFLRNLDK